MSWSERFVRDHKRQTDCAIHRAYLQLASEPLILENFHQLLYCVRQRAARLFDAPVVRGHHPGVEALVNLSRFHKDHLRPIEAWEGTSSSWRSAVSSLAQHLVSRFHMPAFLAAAWYACDEAGDEKRGWFLAHSQGASFRSLPLPIAMTRRMEHIFLGSSDHLTIEWAIRKAELTALGASPALIDVVMKTRLAWDLSHGVFWRTFWLFLIQSSSTMDLEQVAPMIDYLHAIRHERVPVDSPEGMVFFEPPQSDFSLKGRTVPSMLRLMQLWHRTLGIGGSSFSWQRPLHQPLIVNELVRELPQARELPHKQRCWRLMELTNSAQLRCEGSALHHCVASYADRCHRGVSRIWSLRYWQDEKIHHVLTIEVDPARRAIVQLRGKANRSVSGKPLRLVEEWADRERLRLVV